jgi:hypothetical protein
VPLVGTALGLLRLLGLLDCGACEHEANAPATTLSLPPLTLGALRLDLTGTREGAVNLAHDV